ncbi:hypothetical protein FACS1894120_0190 [Clostridia bacterium]|nr:hypothetical protein FACS1894120_0190 [Clostridia bacterium]
MDEPIVIGVLRTPNVIPRNILKTNSDVGSLFLLAKNFGVKVVGFTPADVDLQSGTVNGYVLSASGTGVDRVVCPVPKVTDNSNLFSDEFRRSDFEKFSLLTLTRLPTTKYKTYCKLKENGRYAHILIPTAVVDSFDTLLQFLGLYGSVIVKPAVGCRGSKIFCIAKEGDRYALTQGTNHDVYDLEQLKMLCENFFGRYIVSKFIRSVTHENEPFDLRVHSRRDGGGGFVPFIFPRIGNPKGVVSNIATGGYTYDTKAFLQREFGSLSAEIYNSLYKLGKEFPPYYQKFWNVPIPDCGLDIGITRQGDGFSLNLFEVNTYSSYPPCYYEDSVVRIGYWKSLYRSVT